MVAPLRRSQRNKHGNSSIEVTLDDGIPDGNSTITTSSTRTEADQQLPVVAIVSSPASLSNSSSDTMSNISSESQSQVRRKRNIAPILTSSRRGTRLTNTVTSSSGTIENSILAASIGIENLREFAPPSTIDQNLVLPLLSVSVATVPIPSDSITASASLTSPPTSPLLSNRVINAGHMNSHSSPQPTVVEYPNQMQPQQRMHRRRSSTLSPPPPPQTRRTSLSLSSFTTTGVNTTAGSTNNVSEVLISNGEGPLSEFNRMYHQHLSSGASVLRNVIDLPLLPMSSLHNGAQGANVTSTAAGVNDISTQGRSNIESDSAAASFHREDETLPPLPELTTTTGHDNHAEIVPSQRLVTSDEAPLPRRKSSRIAAAVEQKKQKDEENDQNHLPSHRQTKRRRIQVDPTDDKGLVGHEQYDSGKAKAREMCCICMSFPDDVLEPMATLPNCKHEFCTHCILKWADTENSCPLCKQRFTSISIHRRRTTDNETDHPSSHTKHKTKRNRSTPSSAQPYQKIKVHVPTRNQRSEAGIVLDTILQSLTTTNGIITTGNANDPFVTFNFGFRSGPQALAARASFASGVSLQASNIQQQHTVVWGPPISTFSSTNRHQAHSRPPVSNSRSRASTTASNSNNSNNPFHPGQSASNESLYATMLSTAAHQPTLQQAVTSMNNAIALRSSTSNLQLEDEHWGRFLLRVMGGWNGGSNSNDTTPTTPSSPLATAAVQQNPLMDISHTPTSQSDHDVNRVIRDLLDNVTAPTTHNNSSNTSGLTPDRQPAFFTPHDVAESSLFSRIENHRRQAMRNTNASGHQLRQHYMDGYREMQNRMMQHTTETLAATLASNIHTTEPSSNRPSNLPGHTLETAIEIPEDDDVMVWN